MSSSRSKTGCVTCRIRRVKCDEGKPVCQRCVRSHRQCDGYIVQRALIFDPDASRQERRSFQFLREQAHELLEVHNEDDFVLWNQLMLQASHRHEAIRHGVLAMSAYSESLSNPFEANQNILQARRYYLDALRVAAAPAALCHLASTDEVLLLSLLLHCVELFRQQYAEARVHLHAAISIVSAMSPEEVSRSRTAQVVRRLRKSPNLKVNAVTLAASASMPLLCIDSVRERLMQIHGWISHRLYTSRSGHEDVQTLCAGFQLQLFDFKVSLDDFENRSAIRSASELRNLVYIRIMHGLIALAVSIVASDESANMSFLPKPNHVEVRKCLELCKAFASKASDHYEEKNQKQPKHRPIRFGFDTEFILIVLFLASASTDYWLRQEAVALLRSAHRREGSWDSFHAAHIIECLIQASQDQLVISNVAYYYSKTLFKPNEQAF